MEGDPGSVGGDALLLCGKVQRVPACQELGQRRGVPVLRVAAHVIHGNGDIGG